MMEYLTVAPVPVMMKEMVKIKWTKERLRTWMRVMLNQLQLKVMLWMMMAPKERTAMQMELIQKQLLMIKMKKRRRIKLKRMVRMMLVTRVQATKSMTRPTTVIILCLNLIKLMKLT